MLTLAKGEAGRREMRPEPFDASALGIVYSTADNGTYTISGTTDLTFPNFAGLHDLPLTLVPAAGLRIVAGSFQPFAAHDKTRQGIILPTAPIQNRSSKI